ncbi:hypothetical protein [Mycoplasma bradburyae]|uniref:hypothetical protein n=1 Tax=Mycoplasma bradburyae TaxID=2963128 RepID=UPI002341B0FE|nr:hypothetical protein [Mycoplasma bradburyae]MDC4182468.1 hypothetical protein [Mycoplasma bradburyae]
MKRKNILKFISLLGVGSFVVLAAASCKQPVAEKPTKPTKPTYPSNGGSTTNPPSSGGTDNSSSSSGSNSGSGSNMDPNANSGGGMEVTPNYEADKAELHDFASKLTEQDFEIFNNDDKVEKNSIDVNSLNNDSFKLVETKKNTIPVMGWNLGVELVSNSKNTTQGSVKIKVVFTKEGSSDVSTTPVELTITGFKSLQSSVASILFKEQMVAPTQGSATKENKKVLDLGDAMFETLVDLNDSAKAATTPSSETTSASSAGSVESRSSTVMLRDSETPPSAAEQPSVTKKYNLNDKFSHSIKDKIKTDLDALSSKYSEFKSSDLYLTGSAKLVSLYKKESSDWQGTYYLTSKDENNNKLVIKSKIINDFSLDVPGVVIKNLIPDDVKVSVGAIDVDSASFDSNNQSNLESYKKKMTDEASTSKYRFNEKTNQLSVMLDNNKSVSVNPLVVPYVGPDNANKIFFKAKYVFDGNEVDDTNFFGTKLVFKKIFIADEYNSPALSSNEITQNYNGLATIPGRFDKSINNWDWKIAPLTERFEVNRRNATNITNQFFSINDNAKMFNDSIYGTDNSQGKKGYVQLHQNNDRAHITRLYTGTPISITKIERNRASTFIIFPRIAYKNAAENQDASFSYIWPSSVTVLHFNAPTTSTTEPATQS